MNSKRPRPKIEKGGKRPRPKQELDKKNINILKKAELLGLAHIDH
jgi:hypothetical protein